MLYSFYTKPCNFFRYLRFENLFGNKKSSLTHSGYLYKMVNRCSRKEQSILFELFKAFDKIERGHKSDFFLSKKTFSSMHAQQVLQVYPVRLYLEIFCLRWSSLGKTQKKFLL